MDVTTNPLARGQPLGKDASVHAYLARAVAAAAVGVAIALGPSAAAQDREPVIRASVGGELAEGQRARFHATIVHPEGWRALDRVLVSVELQGVALDEVAYDVGEGVISVGAGRAVAGTGNTLTGRFLRVDAFAVRVSAGGNTLELSFPAEVVRDVPEQARIHFLGEDHRGDSADTFVAAVVPEDETGISPTTVILTAAGALLAGGYLGVRVATHRRRPSVYESVARRIVEDREARRRRG